MPAAARARLSPRLEAASVALGLALLAALVFGDHVVRGGFMWDDWENAATTRYRYEPGFLGPLDLRQAAYRPVLQLLIPLTHLAFGPHPALHLAFGLLCAVAACAAFHSLLRAVGGSRAFAGAAAALALVFPWASSTRLWSTATLNMTAVALVLSAAAVALRARERRALAALLCAAGVLTYEAVAGVVLVLPLVYRLRMPWRAALARWRPQAIGGGAAALWVAIATTKPAGGAVLAHARAMAGEGGTLTARALGPWGGPAPAIATGLAVAVTVAARRSGAVRAAAVALAALVAGWLPFVPGEAKYVPSAAGIYDRVNIVAAFALAALVASVAACAGGLVPWPRLRTPVAAAVVVAVGAGWVLHARQAVTRYDSAAAASAHELRAVRLAVPHPPPGTVVVLLHRRTFGAAGVPVFGHEWDLGAALKLAYEDPSLSGMPLAPGEPVRCGRHWLIAGGRRVPYAHAVVVSTREPRAARVRDAPACAAALARLRPSRAGA